MTTWEHDKQHYQRLCELYDEALADCGTEAEAGLVRKLRQPYQDKLEQIERHLSAGDSIYDTAFGQDDSLLSTETRCKDGGRQKLRQALADLCRSYSKLRVYVSDIDGYKLNEIVESRNLESAAFDFIEHLESKGKLDRFCDLFLATEAINENSEFVKFRRWWQQRQNPREPFIRPDTATDPDNLDDDRDIHAHLLVLAKRGGVGDRFLTRVTLKTADKTEIPIQQIDGDLDLTLADFPERLDDWIECSIEILDEIVEDSSADDWQLTVDLFLPTEWLAQPLALWCADRLKKWENINIAIVVRCADRFDRRQHSKSGKYSHRALYKMLRGRRRRFCSALSDVTAPLKKLTWARPSDGFTQEFAALRCTCDWLSGASCEEAWTNLILSGMPLAFWTYAQTATTEEIDATYDLLLEKDRAAFYPAICETRHPNNADGRLPALGVFYEGDTDRYDPQVPKRAR
ncbi:MAG: hypothetical protein ACFB9N_18790 [Geitlerinemataceae cyanobacterium]